MRCGIPLLGDRVAPRCTAADSLLVVSVAGGRVTAKARLHVPVGTLMDLMGLLKRHRIDTLVCGGLSGDVREALSGEEVDVVDNVACSVKELFPAIEKGVLRPGYGLSANRRLARRSPSITRRATASGAAMAIDCIRCADRVCLSGENCLAETIPDWEPATGEPRRILDAAADVSLERERRLCRLAELVYFCLEMGYEKVGLAYCVDLQEPARILAGVLRRFFDVVPVCCKVGGLPLEPTPVGDVPDQIACNPIGQASMLNRTGTDINVVVGLCVGTDTVFSQASAVPVTTLFVKDKSLANNPIGALYSEYYLQESLSPSRLRETHAQQRADLEGDVFNSLNGPGHERDPEEVP